MYSVKINCNNIENKRVFQIEAQNKIEASVYAVERYFAEHTYKTIKSIHCNDSKISNIDLVVNLATQHNVDDFDEIIETLKTLKQITKIDRDVNKVKRLLNEIELIKSAIKKLENLPHTHLEMLSLKNKLAQLEKSVAK